MERLSVKPRDDWQRKVESVGMTFHTLDVPYWDESVCYRFTEREVNQIESAAVALHQLCFEAIDRIIARNEFARFWIPEEFIPLIRRSWDREDWSLYGRFDLIYDGYHPPKLLEYNADTPTALLEAGVVQWFWLQDVFPRNDQFNSIHEKLIAWWKAFQTEDRIYFSCVQDHDEDFATVRYLRDTAIQAGRDTEHIFVEDIGWNDELNRFVDLNEQPIRTMFKLYPWEWLMHETFGPHLLREPWKLIEPPWKMLLSNKAILAVLWEEFPGHPNLLPAYLSPEKLGSRYVQKPLLSREGANITVHDDGRQEQTGGEYGEEGFVYQQYCPPPTHGGCHPVVGAWIVGEEAAGIGIRESTTLITENTSRFVPHFMV